MKYVSFAERMGVEKGIEKGEVMGQVRLCQEMLKQPQTPKTELRKLSDEELAALLERLRKQLLAKGE